MTKGLTHAAGLSQGDLIYCAPGLTDLKSWHEFEWMEDISHLLNDTPNGCLEIHLKGGVSIVHLPTDMLLVMREGLDPVERIL